MSSGEEIHYFADAEISGGVEPPGVGDVGERDGLPFPRRRREPAGTIAARVRAEPTGRSPSWLMGRSEAEMAARGWGAGGEEAAMEGDLNGDDNLPAAAPTMDGGGGADCARAQGQAGLVVPPPRRGPPLSKAEERCGGSAGEAGRGGGGAVAVPAARSRTPALGGGGDAVYRWEMRGRKSISARGRTD
jgi:hypothetical protein